MKFHLFIFTFLSISPSHGQDWHDRWDRSGNTWKEKWNNTLDSINQSSESERIEILGAAVIIGGNEVLTEDRKSIYLRAQAALLAIPGHAKYFRDKVLKLQADRRAAIGKDDYSYKTSIYYNYRGLGALTYLPSPETVRVLGELLENEDIGDTSNPHDLPEVPLSFFALRALVHLPLANKPTKLDGKSSDSQIERDRAEWKKWYAEIKAGQATFLLEGDPQHYTDKGVASPELVQRIERNQRRSETGSPGERKSERLANESKPEASNTKIPIVALIVSCAALAAAFWYLVKIRMR